MQLCLCHGLTGVDELDAHRTRAGEPSRRLPDMEKAVRMIAVPTKYSAAEFIYFAGVSDTRRNVKKSFGHPLFVPQVVVLDPAATVSTPLTLLLSTGMKAVDHAVERFSMLSLDA
jgi:maleylacetate reductase